jgi:hypothetical protein
MPDDRYELDFGTRITPRGGVDLEAEAVRPEAKVAAAATAGAGHTATDAGVRMRTAQRRAGASPAPSTSVAHVEHGLQMTCTDDSTHPAQQHARGMRCPVGEAA